MTRTHDPASNEAAAIDRPQAVPRAAYRRFLPLTTRWLDNDVYGHLNNAVYYGLFDTVVNSVLIQSGGLDPSRGEAIGFVVESGCNYFAPLSFPQPIEAGLRVARIGEVERALRDRHLRRGRARYRRARLLRPRLRRPGHPPAGPPAGAPAGSAGSARMNHA